MQITIHISLLVLACICFILAALGVCARVNLVAAGLALWCLTGLVR